MTKAPKSTLSKKALKDAAPMDVKPFELFRAYGEPVVCDKSDVKRLIKADLENLTDMIGRIGVPEDLIGVAAAHAKLEGWTGEEISFDFVCDSYSGTHYRCHVRKR